MSQPTVIVLKSYLDNKIRRLKDDLISIKSQQNEINRNISMLEAIVKKLERNN